MNNKKIGIIIGLVVVAIASLLMANRLFFNAPQSQEEKVVFIVNRNQAKTQTLDKLKNQDLIKNKLAFRIVLFLKHSEIESGGYNVSKNMSVWQIADKLTTSPDMKWVVIPEGYRKEQIGEKLAKK